MLHTNAYILLQSENNEQSLKVLSIRWIFNDGYIFWVPSWSHQKGSILATGHVTDSEEISAANKSLGMRACRLSIREIPNDWFTCQVELTVSASFLKPGQENGDPDFVPNACRFMQCQTGNQPPAVSKASWEKGGNEYDFRTNAHDLAS